VVAFLLTNAIRGTNFFFSRHWISIKYELVYGFVGFRTVKKKSIMSNLSAVLSWSRCKETLQEFPNRLLSSTDRVKRTNFLYKGAECWVENAWLL